MKDERSNVMSLISLIDSLSSTYLKERLESQGFTGIVPSHGFILHLLTTQNEMTMGALSKAIGRDKSTTTALIKKLEKESLVSRRQCTNDSRKRFITLSTKGKELTSATSIISESLIKTAYRDFSEEEKTSLYYLLKKVKRNFEEA